MWIRKAYKFFSCHAGRLWVTALDNRLLVNAVLCGSHAAISWCDLPERNEDFRITCMPVTHSGAGSAYVVRFWCRIRKRVCRDDITTRARPPSQRNLTVFYQPTRLSQYLQDAPALLQDTPEQVAIIDISMTPRHCFSRRCCLNSKRSKFTHIAQTRNCMNMIATSTKHVIWLSTSLYAWSDMGLVRRAKTRHLMIQC